MSRAILAMRKVAQHTCFDKYRQCNEWYKSNWKIMRIFVNNPSNLPVSIFWMEIDYHLSRKYECNLGCGQCLPIIRYMLTTGVPGSIFKTTHGGGEYLNIVPFSRPSGKPWQRNIKNDSLKAAFDTLSRSVEGEFANTSTICCRLWQNS